MRNFFHRYLAPEGDAAAPAGGAPATAAPATAPASAPAAAATAPTNFIAEAKAGAPPAGESGKPAPVAGEAGKSAPASAPAAAAPKPATPAEMKAALVAAGQKQADVDKLSDTDLQAKYDGIKPIDYGDFKLPDGVTLDKAVVPDIKASFSKHRLTPEQANGILGDLAGKLMSVEDVKTFVKTEMEKPIQLWHDTQAKWQAEVKADSEVGGTNLDKTLSTIATAIDAFSTDSATKAIDAKKATALRQAFAYTGAGNEPNVVRFLAWLAAPFMEGGNATGGKPTGQGNKSMAETLYPSMAGPGNQTAT